MAILLALCGVSAFHASAPILHALQPARPRTAVPSLSAPADDDAGGKQQNGRLCMTVEPAPPPGFAWSEIVTEAAADQVVATGSVVEQAVATDSAADQVVSIESAVDPEATVATEAVAAEMPQKREAYYCNAEGCWIAEAVYCDDTGCWIEEAPAPSITLPDGREFSMEVGVESHSSFDNRAPARKPSPSGIFAPAVVGAKKVMGEKNLNKLRADVIVQHSKVISSFVDTSESAFGQIVLKRMFEAADKDGNGTLDKQEVQEALHALGFKFIKEKQIDVIFNRADLDGNEVIDFEEFVKETPKTLRTGLVKLAKQNGHDLGFLA